MTPADIDSFKLDIGQGSETALTLILALIMFAVALGLLQNNMDKGVIKAAAKLLVAVSDTDRAVLARP